MKFPAGPVYRKPVPTQWCPEDVPCSATSIGGTDPLYTWGVEVNIIWGVILGREDHDCKHDQCYYMKKEVYDKQLCVIGAEYTSFEWWWTFITSELIQMAVSVVLTKAYTRSPKSGGPAVTGCICFFLGPSVFAITIAALVNGVFAKFLFWPFFSSKLTSWVMSRYALASTVQYILSRLSLPLLAHILTFTLIPSARSCPS